jgi:hypothetical protein
METRDDEDGNAILMVNDYRIDIKYIAFYSVKFDLGLLQPPLLPHSTVCSQGTVV